MRYMASPAQIEGRLSKRNLIIRFKNISYKQQMFSTAQNHHEATSRTNLGMFPIPIHIKNVPNLTPPSELVENP